MMNRDPFRTLVRAEGVRLYREKHARPLWHLDFRGHAAADAGSARVDALGSMVG